MVTPARSCEEGSSFAVTCLVHPPSCMRRCVRSKEYQMGIVSPLSVIGGRFELGFAPARTLLIGPGLLAEWFCSPFRTCACVWANVLRNPIAPVLIAAAAAP